MPEPGAPAKSSSRLSERHVLALGLAFSGGFVAAALALAGVTAAGHGTAWAPVHLALAGAATVAIGTFMPHFAVTLAGTRPSDARGRLASLVLLAAGAILVVTGFTLLGNRLAAAGALLQLAGLGIVGWHVAAPWREPLARRHTIVAAAYAVALAELAAGIALGGLVALGLGPVLAAWASLRGTHAWLTLLGGVSLTIFATLVYLAPTVVGARIRPSIELFSGLAGLVIGPPVAALGFAVGSTAVAVAGAGIAAVGAIGQVLFVVDAHRRRGRFTSEHDWRRVAVGHLMAGTGWFLLAVVAAGLELVAGRSTVGWSIGPLAVPLIAGWMLQELVGSWTYLVPSVTPGDPTTHARQRRTLAIASRRRLVAWNVGVGLLWFGLAFGPGWAAAAGGLLLGLAIAVSVATLAASLRTPGRSTKTV